MNAPEVPFFIASTLFANSRLPGAVLATGDDFPIGGSAHRPERHNRQARYEHAIRQADGKRAQAGLHGCFMPNSLPTVAARPGAHASFGTGSVFAAAAARFASTLGRTPASRSRDRVTAAGTIGTRAVRR